MRVNDHNCDKVWQHLKPIEFKLETTAIKINPYGYTYQEYDAQQGFCQIGLESIPGRNEYRLGTVFLRNFYVGLDYDKDLIIIGINKEASDYASAEIIGHSVDPYKPKVGSYGPLIFILILCIIIAVIAAAWYFWKNKKE